MVCFSKSTEAATRSPADAERLRVAHAVCLRPEVMKNLFFVWLLYHQTGNFAEAADPSRGDKAVAYIKTVRNFKM